MRYRRAEHGPALRTAAFLAAFLAAGLAVSACGGSSASRGSGRGVPQDEDEKKPEIILRTEADDERAGAEISKEVGGAMGILDNPKLSAYVNALGQRLVRYAPGHRFSYTFQIVDQDTPNAFALPGGFVYVSRGLLILSNSEDELANVIGHEITHVASRHSAGRQTMIKGVPGPLQFFAMRSIAQYSRDQEREADRLGQGISGLAGFDPGGMAEFLRNLEFTERLRLGASRLPSFMDTHPATVERAATTAARARGIRWRRTPGIVKNRADYLSRLEGLVIGTAASEGVFRGERFIHPEMNFTMTFPPGWKTQNTRQAVGAQSPKRDAVVYLEFDSEGDDPEKASVTYLEKAMRHGLNIRRAQPIKLGGSTAWRVEGSAGGVGGSVRVMITWISYRGMILRLIGAERGGGRYQGSFRNVARSFRPLPAGLRRGLREQRLQIVRSLPGETLESLSRRTGNQWDIQRTAIVNGVFTRDRLSNGQLIKIAVNKDYRATSSE